MLLLEAFLNRWRGTGIVYNFRNPRVISFHTIIYLINLIKLSKLVKLPETKTVEGITGTMLYSVYYFTLFYVLSGSFVIACLGLIMFLLSESMGWGEWVGSLCHPDKLDDKKIQENIDDDEGKSAPFTHYIANFFIKETENYYRYAQLALAIRGAWWAILLYSPLVFSNYIPWLGYGEQLISYAMYLAVIISYAVGFPLACYLSTIKSFNIRNKFISITGAWETQEFYYGFIHFFCNANIVYYIIK